MKKNKKYRFIIESLHGWVDSLNTDDLSQVLSKRDEYLKDGISYKLYENDSDNKVVYQEANVIYGLRQQKAACDANCEKSFGTLERPHIRLSLIDDDIVSLCDSELGHASGNSLKPNTYKEFPTKFCIRECERCILQTSKETNQLVGLRNLNQRVYNMSFRDRVGDDKVNVYGCASSMGYETIIGSIAVGLKKASWTDVVIDKDSIKKYEGLSDWNKKRCMKSILLQCIRYKKSLK